MFDDEKGFSTAITGLVNDVVGLVISPFLYIIGYVVAVVLVPVTFAGNLFDTSTP